MRAVPSTRWEELKETIQYHAKMAALMDSPTIFKVCISVLPHLDLCIALSSPINKNEWIVIE